MESLLPEPEVATYIRHADGSLSIRRDSWKEKPTYRTDLRWVIGVLTQMGEHMASDRAHGDPPVIIRWEQEP